MSVYAPHVAYLDRIREEQRLLPCLIMNFDPESQDLIAWFWYVAPSCKASVTNVGL
jgi:hypothetical protein